MPEKFEFNLGDNVKTAITSEAGIIIGRAEFLKSENQYFVRHANAQGVQADAWFNESALVKAV